MSGLFCDRNVMLYRNLENIDLFFNICSYFDYYIWKYLVFFVMYSMKLMILLYIKIISVRKS